MSVINVESEAGHSLLSPYSVENQPLKQAKRSKGEECLTKPTLYENSRPLRTLSHSDLGSRRVTEKTSILNRFPFRISTSTMAFGERIFCGTETRSYNNPADYNITLFIWKVTSYKTTAAIGTILAVFLFLLAIWNLNTRFSFIELSPWLMITMVVISLLVGVHLKQPRFLKPFQYLCGIFRVICAVISVITALILIIYPSYDFVKEAITGDSAFNHSNEKKLRNMVVLELCSSAVFLVSGFAANAATRSYHFLVNTN